MPLESDGSFQSRGMPNSEQSLAPFNGLTISGAGGGELGGMITLLIGVGVLVAVGEGVKVLVEVAVCEGLEVGVLVGVAVKVFVDVAVAEGVKVGVSVAVGVEEGVKVKVFVGVIVFVAVGVAVAKNDGVNVLANGTPNKNIIADRNSAVIRIKPPLSQRPPNLPDLSGPMRPVFSKTKWRSPVNRNALMP